MEVKPRLGQHTGQCVLTEKGPGGASHRKTVLRARNLLCEHMAVRVSWFLKVFLLHFFLFSNAQPFR